MSYSSYAHFNLGKYLFLLKRQLVDGVISPRFIATVMNVVRLCSSYRDDRLFTEAGFANLRAGFDVLYLEHRSIATREQYDYYCYKLYQLIDASFPIKSVDVSSQVDPSVQHTE